MCYHDQRMTEQSVFQIGDRIVLKDKPGSSVYRVERITSRGYLWLSCVGRMIPFVEHPARFVLAQR